MRPRLRTHFGVLALGLASAAFSVADGPLHLSIGPEQIILKGANQPYLFVARSGVMVIQGPGAVPGKSHYRDKNSYYGIPATTRSVDGGRTWKVWTPPMDPADSPIIEGNVAQLHDGTVMILQWIARGPRPGGLFTEKVWESRDDWETVTGPIEATVELPDAVAGFDDGGEPYPGLNFHRSLIEMPNGDLLATAYGWFKGDLTPTSYMPSMKKFRSLLLRSRDRGRHWSLVSTIAVNPAIGEEGFCEPVLLRLSQGPHRGRLIAHLRTGRITPLYQTESDDEGRTWTTPHPLGIHGVDPDLIEMKNGTLVSGFGWRTAESVAPVKDPMKRRIGPRHGNYLAFSLDQGETWIQVTRITSELTTSYVTVREVSPGRLFFAYDKNWFGRPDLAIAGRFIEVSGAAPSWAR